MDDEPKAQVARTASNTFTWGALMVTRRLSRKAAAMRMVSGVVWILKFAIPASRGAEGGVKKEGGEIRRESEWIVLFTCFVPIGRFHGAYVP